MSRQPLISFPSTPVDGSDPTVGELIPDEIIDAERVVYEYVLAATQGAVPMLSFYGDGRSDQPPIPVTEGWPAYPGKIPAIGVAAGPETDDQAQQMTSGGFAGTVYVPDPDPDATDPTAIVATGDYYAEPLYSPVIVELIHENRDERDRLHNQLRRALFPMRRKLPAMYSLIKKVTLDAEKTDQHVGPQADMRPAVIYVSIFTVHVYHEFMQAEDVRGPTSVIAPVTVTTVLPRQTRTVTRASETSTAHTVSSG